MYLDNSICQEECKQQLRVDIDWVPIDSAVGYKIFQDGVEIESNTPNTSLSEQGLLLIHLINLHCNTLQMELLSLTISFTML